MALALLFPLESLKSGSEFVDSESKSNDDKLKTYIDFSDSVTITHKANDNYIVIAGVNDRFIINNSLRYFLLDCSVCDDLFFRCLFL